LARAAGGDGRSANEKFHAGVQSEVKEEVFHAVKNQPVVLGEGEREGTTY
jgi:hypothetical protein